MKNNTFPVDENVVEVKKDKECVYCEKLFDCIGKPVGVERCIQFKDRRKGK